MTALMEEEMDWEMDDSDDTNNNSDQEGDDATSAGSNAKANRFNQTQTVFKPQQVNRTSIPALRISCNVRLTNLMVTEFYRTYLLLPVLPTGIFQWQSSQNWYFSKASGIKWFQFYLVSGIFSRIFFF